MHKSIQTIDSPEFINLQPLDINPLMTKCEIKVLYIGANRNGSFISKEVATKIGETLRGAPIVGYYNKEKEDFCGHGEKVVIDDDGIHFDCMTVPYGFVSPDAEVWFQNFEDFDEMGNSVVHTYLMTTGYLWTSQFPESSLAVKQGRPHSMELDEASTKGQWEYNYAENMDFYIIHDTIVSKLCILGEDTEPCFEGASVTQPNLSNKFTLDDKFKNTLYSMMQDLKSVLEGEKKMVQETETFTEKQEEMPVEESVEETFADKPASSEFAKENDDKEEKEDKDAEDTESEEETEDADSEEDTEDKKKEKFELLNQQYTSLLQNFSELQASYSDLQSKYQELLNFKTEIDNQKKDALISEFFMLSEEDKADVIANKQKYSLDEIKAKLSIICFDKKINFTSSESKEENKEDILTYKVNHKASNLPEWVALVKEEMK